ncbi:P-loop containing nucleoside triphosphate hydrolase protein [Haematococcus lacustris]
MEPDIVLFAKRKSKKPRPAPHPSAGSTPTNLEPSHAQASEDGAAKAAKAAVEPASPSRTSQPLVPQPAESFKELGISDWLCSVCKSLGMQRPTPVQQGCIPAILAGKDVIGLAQTGSGKTAAFALPILQRLARDPYGVFALVLTPTRELAIQIAEQFRALGAGMSLRDCVVIGGADMAAQTRELGRRPHLVIATPGRLKGLLDAEQGLAQAFQRTAFLVMDEADRLLDPGFETDLRTILLALPPGDARQTLLFSATMTQALIKLQQSSLDDAFLFQAYQGLRTADTVREQYVFMPHKVKEVYLAHLLGLLPTLKVRSALVFCSTCKGCALLALMLQELGLQCAALHSGRPQKQRLAALASFKSETVPLLLATDVASRGLDIPSVDLVINFDLPLLASDYVHRVGRTARAGRSGWAVSLVTQYDVDLVHAIEALIGHQLEEYALEEAEVLKGLTKPFACTLLLTAVCRCILRRERRC